MFSPRKRLAAAALAAAACVLAPAMASAGVVVSASGPSARSFPVGKKIGDSERIVLRAGDTLTVLDGNGTRVLRGAGTYSLDQQAGPSQRASFATLTQRRTASRVTTGATRTDDLPRGRRACGTSTSAVPAQSASSAPSACGCGARARRRGDLFTGASAAARAIRATFGDGDSLPLAGTQRRCRSPTARALPLSGPSGAGGGTLTSPCSAPRPKTPEALAQQLIEKGCTQQLELLSAATMIEEG